MMFFDPTFVILIPGIILAAWAQSRVSGAFNRYSRVLSKRGVTAARVAESILSVNGIDDVKVEPVAGNLTDHYDSRKKVLRLSTPVYNSTSIAAIGIAAHEAGHAIQHDLDYYPLRLRSTLVPIANFGNYASWILLLLGIFMGLTGLAQIGVFLFTGVILFQLVTLPVEFNASSRAIAILESQGFLEREELPQAKKVLNAAALTYVAAALMAILQLVRLLALLGFMGNSDE